MNLIEGLKMYACKYKYKFNYIVKTYVCIYKYIYAYIYTYIYIYIFTICKQVYVTNLEQYCPGDCSKPKHSTISWKKGQHPQRTPCMNAYPYSLDLRRVMLRGGDVQDCNLWRTSHVPGQRHHACSPPFPPFWSWPWLLPWDISSFDQPSRKTHPFV